MCFVSKGDLTQKDFEVQYLADVGCPFTFQKDQNEEEVLEWLLQLAVGLAYEDLGKPCI